MSVSSKFQLYRVLNYVMSRGDRRSQVAAMRLFALIWEMDQANCYELHALACDKSLVTSLTFEGYVEQGVSVYLTVRWPRGITVWSRVIIEPSPVSSDISPKLHVQMDLELNAMQLYIEDLLRKVARRLPET